jgi:hypothetical protein
MPNKYERPIDEAQFAIWCLQAIPLPIGCLWVPCCNLYIENCFSHGRRTDSFEDSLNGEFPHSVGTREIVPKFQLYHSPESPSYGTNSNSITIEHLFKPLWFSQRNRSDFKRWLVCGLQTEPIRFIHVSIVKISSNAGLSFYSGDF